MIELPEAATAPDCINPFRAQITPEHRDASVTYPTTRAPRTSRGPSCGVDRNFTLPNGQALVLPNDESRTLLLSTMLSHSVGLPMIRHPLCCFSDRDHGGPTDTLRRDDQCGANPHPRDAKSVASHILG